MTQAKTSLVEIQDKINNLVNLLIVVSLAQETCAEIHRPMGAIVDFAIPALNEIKEMLNEHRNLC